MILIEEVNNYGTSFAYNHDRVLVAKTCGKCSELKQVTDFHKTKQNSSGTVTACKSCIKTLHNKHYRKNTKVYFSSYDMNGQLVSRECSKCKIIHLAKHFHPHRKGKDGFNSYCMDCTSVEGKAYRNANIEKLKKRSRDYFENNKESVNLFNRIRRKTVRKQKLFSSQFEDEILKVYKEANSINANSVIKVAVDHITPVIHPNVCGLHYHTNLVIIPDSENCSKSNKWDGTADNLNWKNDWRKSRELIRG